MFPSISAYTDLLFFFYSRWDTHDHRLADFTDPSGLEVFPGTR